MTRNTKRERALRLLRKWDRNPTLFSSDTNSRGDASPTRSLKRRRTASPVSTPTNNPNSLEQLRDDDPERARRRADREYYTGEDLVTDWETATRGEKLRTVQGYLDRCNRWARVCYTAWEKHQALEEGQFFDAKMMVLAEQMPPIRKLLAVLEKWDLLVHVEDEDMLDEKIRRAARKAERSFLRQYEEAKTTIVRNLELVKDWEKNDERRVKGSGKATTSVSQLWGEGL